MTEYQKLRESTSAFIATTYQFWVSLCKTCHSPFSTIYLTSCYINLDTRINVQCPQCKSSFLRCQRAQTIFPFQVRIYYFFFPPWISIPEKCMLNMRWTDDKHNFQVRKCDANSLFQEKWMAHLILVNSSTSSLLQPWVQPENANMSISYLRWSTRKGPFCLKRLITLLPNSSIWEVNLRALKFTLQRSFWSSKGWPLLASRASVLFRCTTLCFHIRGRIYTTNTQTITITLQIGVSTNENDHYWTSMII